MFERVKPSEWRGSRPTDQYAEFFGQFANKRVKRGFTKFHMTAREVPDAWVRGASGAPVPQQQPLVPNQSPNYYLLHPYELITVTLGQHAADAIRPRSRSLNVVSGDDTTLAWGTITCFVRSR
jgi:hypothetical protein